MLRDKDISLQHLPGSYLQHVIDHVQRPGQSTSDIVRRSAGIPYTFVALFLSEIGGPRRVCHLSDIGEGTNYSTIIKRYNVGPFNVFDHSNLLNFPGKAYVPNTS